MNIKNIIWDFDGTIMDTYPAIVQSAYAVSKNNKVNLTYDEIYKLSKITLRTALEKVSEVCGKTFEQLFSEYLVEYPKFPYKELKVYPLVEEALKKVIELGGVNYIITNRDIGSLTEHLVLSNLDSYFDFIISGSSGFARKPDPESFINLKERFNLSVEDTIAVGDRDLDLNAALGAGFSGLFYAPLAEYNTKNFKMITSYQELLDLLK